MSQQTQLRPTLGASSRFLRLRLWLVGAAVAAMLLPGHAALAHEFKAGSITIEHPCPSSLAADATATSAPVGVVLDLFEAIEPNLTRTAYGWVLLLKLTLFAVLLALAAVNRFRLTSALSGRAPSLEGGH